MERKWVQESPVGWGNQALELDKIFVGVDKHNISGDARARL